MARTLTARYAADVSAVTRETGKLQKTLGKQGKAAGDQLTKGVGTGAAGMSRVVKGIVGAAAGAAVVGKLFQVVRTGVDDAREAAKANARLDAVLTSMGRNSATVSKQLDDQATAMERATGVEAETVKASQALLATFGNVAASAGQVGGAMERATALTSDLAAAGFGSAEGNAKMLGKALNDPLKGISALSRAGVTFSDVQKKQIEGFVKGGDMAAAQNVILREVEKQVGGTAAATADNATRMSNAWGEVGEAVGGQLLPYIDRFQALMATKVLPAITDAVPKVVAFAAAARDKLAPPVKAVTATLSSMARWVADNRKLLGDLAVVFGTVAAAVAVYTVAQRAAVAVQAVMAAGGLVKFITGVIRSTQLWTAAQAALNVIMSLNPLALVVIAVAAFVAAIVIAYRNSETFRRVVNAAWSSVKAAVLTVWEKALRPAFTALAKFFTTTIPDAARWVRDKVTAAWSLIRTILLAHWTFLRDRVLTPLRTFFTVTIPGAATTVRDKVTGAFTAVRDHLDRVRQAIKANTVDKLVAGFRLLQTVTSDVRTKVLAGFSAIRDGIRTRAVDAVSGFREAFAKLEAAAKTPVRFVIETVLENGVLAAFRKVAGAVGLDSLAGKMHVALPAGFYRGGPTGSGPDRRAVGIAHANEHYATAREVRKTPGGHGTWERMRGLIRRGVTDWIPGTPGFFLGGGVAPAAGPQNRHRSGYPWARWAGDIPAGMGSPVRAYKAGTVAAVRHLTTSYGKHVRVNHGSERTLYAHMSSILVKVGQTLARAQQIGRVGSTGNSTGPHLHFELQGGSGPLDAPGSDGGDSSVVTKVVDYVKRLKSAMSKPLEQLKTLGASPFGQSLAAGTRAVASGLTAKIKATPGAITTAVGNAAGSVKDKLLAQAPGQTGARAAARQLGMTGGTYPGHQPQMNKALDFMTPSKAAGDKLAAHLQAKAARYNIMYLIWFRRIWSVARKAEGWRHYFDGNSSNPSRAHTNHVHASFYDQGGWLPTGTTLVHNGTGRPEMVRTGAQEDALQAQLQAGQNLSLAVYLDGERLDARFRVILDEDRDQLRRVIQGGRR